MGLSQKVHPEIFAKIHELVSIGTVEPSISDLIKKGTQMLCSQTCKIWTHLILKIIYCGFTKKLMLMYGNTISLHIRKHDTICSYFLSVYVPTGYCYIISTSIIQCTVRETTVDYPNYIQAVYKVLVDTPCGATEEDFWAVHVYSTRNFIFVVLMLQLTCLH